MKNYYSFLLFVLIGAVSIPLFGQEDTTMQYYNRLADSEDESDQAQLEKELYKLLQSEEESDWLTAQQFFYRMNKGKVVDSITNVIRDKFPEGELVRNEEVQKVYDEKDPSEKEKRYLEWVRRFPPSKFGADIIYDYARNAVSSAYASESNIEKAVQYADMIETPAWKGEGWAGPANILLKKGYTKEAKELYKKAIDHVTEFTTQNDKDDRGVRFAKLGLSGYLSSYAGILYDEQNYEEALTYMEKAYEAREESRKVDLNDMYARVLMALGRDEEAFNKLDEAFRHGMATDEMKEDLKALYVKLKGNEGYEEYMADLNKILVENIKEELSTKMINEPAPAFTLQDLDGNTVSLASLKGKIVILDFWATWCGPCKRSFPSMKMAVERFRDNPNVKFLFIHTWERNDGAKETARKYIQENDYPFQVLMDLKNEDGVNKVVTDYKVQGIPAKFVIDKNGNIRFRLTGVTAGPDAAVEEIAIMINLADDAS